MLLVSFTAQLYLNLWLPEPAVGPAAYPSDGAL